MSLASRGSAARYEDTAHRQAQNSAKVVNLWVRHCREGLALRCRWRVAAVPLATKTRLTARREAKVVSL